MRFEFATSGRIVFGPGAIQEAPAAVADLLVDRADAGVLLVAGSTERAGPLRELLAGRRIELLTLAGEPTVEQVIAGALTARQAQCGLVLGIGGGSAIDAAKAIAALAENPGDPLDYLEVIGKGRALTRAPLPCIAIPTTAGTGSEVTRNAVLFDPKHRVKVSMRSPLMLPRVAIVDPELTRTMPPNVTAFTGLDALTQLIEAFVCTRANPLTDGLCREGIRRAVSGLARAVYDGEDMAARENMSIAGLLGGLALANAGLGAVHGFAGPIGGMFKAPHGAICAALLPHVMAANIQALRERETENGALDRYDEVAFMLTGREDIAAEEGVEWVRELCDELAIKPLGAFGVGVEDIPAIVEKAQAAGSMKANPLPLTRSELADVLAEALL